MSGEFRWILILQTVFAEFAQVNTAGRTDALAMQCSTILFAISPQSDSVIFCSFAFIARVFPKMRCRTGRITHPFFAYNDKCLFAIYSKKQGFAMAFWRIMQAFLEVFLT